jgi:hypothetical protein
VKPTKDATEHIHVWAGAGHSTALGQIVQLEDPVRGRVTTVVPSPFHEALCAKADEMGALLVILDPINQLLPTGGSENDSITAGALISLAGEIQQAAERGRARMNRLEGYPRPMVLLAHHERKAAGADAGSGAARGTTAFIDNARWACRMSTVEAGDVHRTHWEVTKVNSSVKVDVCARKGADEHGMTWRRWSKGDVAELEAAEVAAATENGRKKQRLLDAEHRGRREVNSQWTARGGAAATSGAPTAPADEDDYGG